MEVTVTRPIEPARLPAEVGSWIGKAKRRSALSAKIFVVDDGEQNRGVLTTLLQYCGHGLIEASDGEEALEKTRADRSRLIITDILMRRVDGRERVSAAFSPSNIARSKIQPSLWNMGRFFLRSRDGSRDSFSL